VICGSIELFVVAKTIAANTIEMAEIKEEIAQEREKKDSYEELISQYNDVAKDNFATDITSLLPATNNFVKVIEELETIAGEAGVSIVTRVGDTLLTSDGFEINEKEATNRTNIGFVLPAGATYDFIEIELTIRGSYQSLTQFLDLFSQSEYYMNIGSLNISNTGGGALGTLDMMLTVQVFVQKVLYN
jgi:SepF-like predicted cell division protein (DUF552 family)